MVARMMLSRTASDARTGAGMREIYLFLYHSEPFLPTSMDRANLSAALGRKAAKEAAAAAVASGKREQFNGITLAMLMT